jgi:hypothetical protein
MPDANYALIMCVKTSNLGEQEIITITCDRTIYPPSTPYDKWNGERWVTEPEPKQRELAATETKAGINRCQNIFTTSGLDMATVEKSRYDAWRKYRVLLTRVDTSLAPDIDWPEPPKD